MRMHARKKPTVVHPAFCGSVVCLLCLCALLVVACCCAAADLSTSCLDQPSVRTYSSTRLGSSRLISAIGSRSTWSRIAIIQRLSFSRLTQEHIQRLDIKSVRGGHKNTDFVSIRFEWSAAKAEPVCTFADRKHRRPYSQPFLSVFWQPEK